MAKPITQASWQSLLPDVYHWVEKVSIDWPSSPKKGALSIVAVKQEGDQGSGKGGKSKLTIASTLPSNEKESLTKLLDESAWQAKGGSLFLATGESQYLLVPLCTLKTTQTQISRQFGIDLGKASKEYQRSHLNIYGVSGLDSGQVFEGLSTSYYDAALFKGSRISGETTSPGFPEQVSWTGWKDDPAQFNKSKELSRASAFARMLQDAPANYLTPMRFGEIAASLAKDLGLKCTVLGPKDLEKMGAGSFLSVAAGSVSEPRLIAVEIPGQTSHKTIALCGKGLTFDSGGISLKPGLGMGEMKYDMSGGSAVLGAVHFLGKVKPACNVVAIIGAVENMIGPTATRPGDIVVAMNGKSIDVQNTDAEGRLVLADLLHYANSQHKPDLIIDIATLTGACLHALGHAGAGLMSNDQPTADYLLSVSRDVGEPLWQLPLWPELEKEVKGEWSDVQNIAKPNVQAGSIMGGMFLAEFVGDTKWAHLDIAGTGWSCKATGYPQSGGSAYGLRLLSEVCLRG